MHGLQLLSPFLPTRALFETLAGVFLVTYGMRLDFSTNY